MHNATIALNIQNIIINIAISHVEKFVIKITSFPLIKKLGLVETETDNDELSRYRIASRCIFCPSDTTGPSVLRAIDKEILQWLKNAGVRLTVAELVYLIENGINPTQDLLYTDNRQRLIERIYTVDTIADNLLENQMETAKCRDAVVQSLMRLLKKKLVLVL